MRSIVILLAAVVAAAGCHRREPAASPAEPTRTAVCGRMMGRCGDARMPIHGMHRRMMTRVPADGAVSAAAAAVDSAGACPATTRVLVDQGRSLFSARGNCAACHGAEGGGTPIAPDLTDGAWLHGDGSYEAIADVVAAGVPRPPRFPGAMPAKGGADLAPVEACAVAAYVHSLSRHQGH